MDERSDDEGPAGDGGAEGATADAGEDDDGDGDLPPETRSKVGRVLREYGLDGLGAELEARWLGDGYERQSLRDLADLFNTRVLERAMLDAGMDPLEGEVENTYDLLTGDDVSTGVRTQAENRLERAGLDVEGVRSDFVSHQAVHTYLRKYRGAEQAADDGVDRVDRTVSTVRRLESRTVAVVENSLTTLRNAGTVALGSFDVLVDVRVFCSDCGRQFDVVELLERGGCDCEE
jgi:hypothetical protein